MNRRKQATVGAACATAFAVGYLTHGPYDNKATQLPTKGAAITNKANCVRTIERNHWPAGDLCDTLEGVTKQQWAGYNAGNGWALTIPYLNCWYTSATTAPNPYTICWDGTITKGSN